MFRLGEIVVVLRDLADANVLGSPRGKHYILVLPETWYGVVGQLGLAGTIDECRRLIGQNQRVFVLVVLEEIENALVFQKP